MEKVNNEKEMRWSGGEGRSKIVCNKRREMESQAVGENRVEGVGQWACNAETGKGKMGGGRERIKRR